MRKKIASSILALVTISMFGGLAKQAGANQDSIVRINEVAWMGTLASSNAEWIELYNTTDNEIDLTGWRLEAADGSPKIELTGRVTAHNFFLLERTSDDTVPGMPADQIYTGSLSNTGEDLRLYNTANQIMDELSATAGWPGGDNTTKQTLEYTATGTWSSSAVAGGTPKAINSATTPSDTLPSSTSTPPTNTTLTANSNTTSLTSPDSFIKVDDIVINEVFSNPIGNDNLDEFIELKNVSEKIIDLRDWQLSNDAGQLFTIPSMGMGAGSIVTLRRPETMLALNNDSEKITLKTAAGKIISQINISNPAPEGKSYQRTDSGQCDWAEPSPSQNNTLIIEPAPQAIINGPSTSQTGEGLLFDGSDSFDPLNRPLQYHWEFDDGVTTNSIQASRVFTKAGKYTLTLTVKASELSQTKTTKIITITNPVSTTNSEKTTTATTDKQVAEKTTTITAEQNQPLRDIIISEFLASTKRGDTQEEFIELYNREDVAIDLDGWQLDDDPAGSKPYVMPAKTIIQPDGYLVLPRSTTQLVLSNTHDSVRLFDNQHRLIDSYAYTKTTAGNSFSRDEQLVWHTDTTPTPDQAFIDVTLPTDTITPIDSTNTAKTVTIDESKTKIQQEPNNSTRRRLVTIASILIVAIGCWYGYRANQQRGQNSQPSQIKA